MKERGLTTDQSYLFETAETAESKYARRDKKENGKAAFGWDVFNQDTLYKAYEKRLANLPKQKVMAATASDELSEDQHSYGQGVVDDPGAVDRMVTELQEKQEKNKKFGRRRTALDAEDVDYINPQNAHFNKKIKRAFDKYTVEIRQNLERGTAL
eukprot:FR742098.1.p1 GENE.FR742098.1~~FR742098.1.p1  ORF type:complete len:168 (+),score=33.96 FR742098.1:40-504(+)